MSSQLTTIATFILFLILARATWVIWQKSLLSEQKLQQVQMELDRLNDREKDLTEKISYLSTDQGIEAELRTKFKAVRDGESVAVILGDNEPASTSVQSGVILTETGTNTQNLSWWQKLLRFVGL